MNRIYQGRVTKVEIPDPETKGKWLLLHRDSKRAAELTEKIPALRAKVEPEIDERAKMSKKERERKPKSPDLQEYEQLRDEERKEWEQALWQHHQLFQDAVNYSFAAFAAMVPDDCKEWPWGDFRAAVARSWLQYRGRTRKWDTPFGKPCELVCGTDKASFAEFRTRLFQLTGAQANEKQRFAALKQLFAGPTAVTARIHSPDAGTEGALAGGSKDVFGKRLVKLCSQVTEAVNEVEEAQQRKTAGQLIEKITANKNAKLSWNDVFAFKATRASGTWSPKEAIREIKKHARALARAYVPKGESNPAFVHEYRVFRRKLRDVKKAPKTKPARTGAGGDDLKAAILFHLHPCREFRELFLRFTQHRKGQQNTEVPKSDACYVARFAGEKPVPVFPFFIDLLFGKASDPAIGQGIWPDFEKAVFAEVFVKIGQFLVTGSSN